MKKNVVLAFILSLILTVSTGFSLWTIADSGRKTTNPLVNKISGDTVTLTIHQRKNYVADSGIKYEYFIPATIDNNSNEYATFDIRDKDKNGNSSTEKYPIDDSYTEYSNKKTSPDEQTVYYDVDSNGTYNQISQHSQNYGPKNLKSLKINVTNWKTAKDGEFGLAWRVKASNGTLLKFEGNCANVDKGGKNMYKSGDVVNGYDGTEPIYTSEPVINGKYKITEVFYQRATVYNTNDVNVSAKTAFLFIKTHFYHYQYFPQIEQRKVVISEEISGYEDVAQEKKITVKKGSTISPLTLGIENYKQCGFYSDQDYSTLFDFSSPIASDGDIYLSYFEKKTNGKLLANAITGLTSSSTTLNIYDGKKGGSNGDYDVSSDNYYDNGIVFMDACTIASGRNVNLTYGNNQLYIADDPETCANYTENYGAHRTSTDNSMCVDYDGSTYNGYSKSSTYIALNGDLTVKGKLTIGAKIGGHTNQQLQSYVIGDYCVLNLYGHDLIVDGGTVMSYGVIMDTIGTGKIIVKNGGTLKGTVSVSDARGAKQMILGMSKRQTPFTEYKFMYIAAPIYVYNGSTLMGYFKLDFSDDFGITNSFLSIVGKTNSIFCWNDENADTYVLVDPYKVSKLYNVDGSTIYTRQYYLRDRIDLYANIKVPDSVTIDVQVTFASQSLQTNIDFVRIDIPISPFFDIRLLENFSLDLYSKLVFYPGSSFYTASGTCLNFKFSSQNPKEYPKVEKSALGKGVTICGEKRYLSGGIETYSKNLNDNSIGSPSRFQSGVSGQSAYWKYEKMCSSVIDGDITFDQGINTKASTNDGYYFISGNIQLSNSALKTIISNKTYIKTYDVKGELGSGFLFDGTHMATSYQVETASSYSILPLMSGDKAYVIDNSHSLEGTFNLNTGVFSSKYSLSIVDEKIKKTLSSNLLFLKTDDDMYEDGSDPSNQTSRVDRMLTVSEIDKSSYSEKYKLFKDASGQLYVYLAGINVRVLENVSYSENELSSSTITVTLRKFCSNNNTECNTNSSKYDKCYLNYSESNGCWSYKSFA